MPSRRAVRYRTSLLRATASSSGIAHGSIIAAIMTAHISQSRNRRGASHVVVIIHADGPVIGPYMSRDRDDPRPREYDGCDHHDEGHASQLVEYLEHSSKQLKPPQDASLRGSSLQCCLSRRRRANPFTRAQRPRCTLERHGRVAGGIRDPGPGDRNGRLQGTGTVALECTDVSSMGRLARGAPFARSIGGGLELRLIPIGHVMVNRAAGPSSPARLATPHQDYFMGGVTSVSDGASPHDRECVRSFRRRIR